MAKVVKVNFLCPTKNLARLMGKNQSNITKIREESLATVCIDQQTVVVTGYTLITLSSVERVEDNSPTLAAARRMIPPCREYNRISENHLIYLLIEEANQICLEKGLLEHRMSQTLTSISVGKLNNEYCIVQIIGGNIGVQNASILLLGHLRLNMFNSSN